MDQTKLDKIIAIIREDMTVGAAGFTGAADSKGPTAGFDPVMKGPIRRKKKYVSGGYGSRKRWLDHLKTPRRSKTHCCAD